MKSPQIKLALIVLAFIFSCNTTDDSITEEETPASNKPNILLIIADDMGLDATPSYAIGN